MDVKVYRSPSARGWKLGWLEVSYFGKPHVWRWGISIGERFPWYGGPAYRRMSIHLGRVRVLWPVKSGL